jgi:hypothetical protein
MADVFISYSSRNRAQAQHLAQALAERRWSVWWDREIQTGQAFDEAIERELDSARAVVVLWSRESVESEWVKNEAASAAERGVLLPARIDDTRPPLEFRRKQTADLIDWSGQASHDGFVSLCRAIDGLLNQRASPTPPTAVPAPIMPVPQRRRTGLVVAGGAIAVAVVALVGYGAMAPQRSGPIDPVHEAAKQAAESTTAAAQQATAAAQADLADAVVGTYAGDVIADSQGSSRSNVVVTLQKIGPNAVRVTSPYSRIGTLEVELTQAGQQIVNATGNTPFAVNLAATPAKLLLNPQNELAYSGTKQP